MEGSIPKKVRFFQLEVSRGSVNTTDTLIQKPPWIFSCPSWCVLCHKSCKSLMHILDDTFSLINMLLRGHPFKKDGETLFCIIKGFLRFIWKERNHRILKGMDMDFILFFDHICYTSLSWYKLTS